MRRALVFAAMLVATTHLAFAQDWPGWRGPTRDGVVPTANVPDVWPETFGRMWRVEIGEGYSSPIVSDGRVFVHSRRDRDEIVTAIDLTSGTIVWQQRYRAEFVQNTLVPSGFNGPFATPVVSEGRLFTIGVSGLLSSWDARTGALQWRNDYSASADTSQLFYGTAASPLLDRDLLIVHVGSDVEGGRVIALDPNTGADRWTWRNPGPGYGSPIVIDVGGARQVATYTQESIVGLDAETGALQWSVPFPDEWMENIVTPIWTGTHLVVSGPRQGTHAYAIRRIGGTWQATEAWATTDVTMYMSTPVTMGGTIYGHSSKRRGQFVALDAATGAVRWSSEGREGEHASVLLTEGHLLLLTTDAELIVAERGTAEFIVAHQYTVADGATWAVPVLLRDGLIVRDATSVIRLTAGRE